MDNPDAIKKGDTNRFNWSNQQFTWPVTVSLGAERGVALYFREHKKKT